MGVESELAKGRNGVFDVACDGELVFSKHRDGRYPEAGEIVRALQARRGG